MLAKLTAFWATAAIWQKVLLVLAAPLILILIVGEAATMIGSSSEKKKEDAVKAEDNKLQADVNLNNTQATKESGKIEQLQTDKQEAVANENKKSEQGAADYYNNLKPDGK